MICSTSPKSPPNKWPTFPCTHMQQPASLGGGQWGAKAVLFAIRQTLDQMISAQRQNPSSHRVRECALKCACSFYQIKEQEFMCVCRADGQQLTQKTCAPDHWSQFAAPRSLNRPCDLFGNYYSWPCDHLCVCAVHFMIISFLESSARKSLTCILKCRLQMHFVMKSASKHRVLIGHLIQFLRLSWLCSQQQTTILMAILNYYTCYVEILVYFKLICVSIHFYVNMWHPQFKEFVENNWKST